MAKKSSIQRELKRSKLVNKFQEQRQEIKRQLKKEENMKQKLLLSFQLQNLPRNSAPTRLHNRCTQTGRPRGYYRYFGLSRIRLREMAHEGFLPGVVKASW
jgi:small subunit ribosomal protein S14